MLDIACTCSELFGVVRSAGCAGHGRAGWHQLAWLVGCSVGHWAQHSSLSLIPKFLEQTYVRSAVSPGHRLWIATDRREGRQLKDVCMLHIFW